MPDPAKNLRVAIVHDWLVGGGAERVVEELHKMYPDALIYTSYCTDEWRQRLDNKVVTGWLQHFGKLRKFMVLPRIWWFTHLDFSSYDLVLSSSGNGEAKSIRTPTSTTHICYCHAPTHFYWRHHDKYLKDPGFGAFNWLARLGLRLLVGPLRWWDKHRASTRPDYYVANSSHTAAEIKRYYDRDAIVIHPPVDVERFTNATQPTERTGFITVGRQVPHKHTDLIVRACTQLNLPLTVVGRGPEHDNLVRIAGPTVTFRTDASDAEVPELMAKATGFIFASYEDFGITPIEALATGTPIIAYQAGGARDYVIPEKTGQFFAEQTTKSLMAALQAFDPQIYEPAELIAQAQRFSEEAFQDKLTRYIEEKLQEKEA